MIAKRLLIAALCLLILQFQLPEAPCQTVPSSQPRLVLIIVLDQFNYDYLSRYQDKFGSGGFRYLMEHGANFVNCKYKQATTVTAVGHSIISSGSYPWSSGVVANSWLDRRKGKEVMAATDENVQLVGANGPGASSKVMLGTTIGDEMKLSSNGRSKVITLSLKDRAALFLAGRLANQALWWDYRSGNFVSSSQFGTVLPAWAKSFNDQHYADKYFGKPWQRLLQESSYSASTRDDYTYERPFPGDGRQFPHIITGGSNGPSEEYYTTFAATPWANQMLADLAREALEHEALGQHLDTDLLAISFSSTDHVGHAFGPYSQEVEDQMLRLDQSLASLFQFVDQKVGLSNCLIVLSGDHGSMPVPEFLKERGMDSGRIDAKSFKQLLDASLDSRLSADDWIEAFIPPNLYLNLDAIDKQKYRQPDVEALAAKLAHSVPGIGDVYTAFQFFNNQLPAGPYVDAVKKSYYWGRSGELYVTTRPGYIFSSDPNGTGHGSPYSYDTQVPLILCGTTIRAGKYGQDASPADIPATVAAILGINLPSLCEGRVLQEALGQVLGPPAPRGLVQPGQAEVVH